jgi:tetratricopeptide (TPR) repeat protein
MIDIFDYMHKYFGFVLLIHFGISVFLSIIEAVYVTKRFKLKDEKDKEKLKLLFDKSKLYKFLFKFSLHKNNQVSAFFWFLILNFSMFFLGYIASIWIAIFLVNVKYEAIHIKTEIINLEEFKYSVVNINRIFGESSILRTILNENVPLSKRLQAFSSITAQISPFSISIIKQTLTSHNDEIRLYAYSILNNLETKISDALSKELMTFENSKKDEKKYNAAKEIAFLYWEQLYINLADQALEEVFIKNIKKYSSLAIKYFEKINNEEVLFSLLILQGKLFLKEGDYKSALEVFKKAEKINNKSISLVPYMAEVYYQFKDFKKVKELLNKNKEFMFNQKLYPIIYQWSE